jgi:hypothetical protein
VVEPDRLAQDFKFERPSRRFLVFAMILLQIKRHYYQLLSQRQRWSTWRFCVQAQCTIVFLYFDKIQILTQAF